MSRGRLRGKVGWLRVAGHQGRGIAWSIGDRKTSGARKSVDVTGFPTTGRHGGGRAPYSCFDRSSLRSSLLQALRASVKVLAHLL